eukprot:804272-Prymnesium_polylepis.1
MVRHEAAPRDAYGMRQGPRDAYGMRQGPRDAYDIKQGRVNGRAMGGWEARGGPASAADGSAETVGACCCGWGCVMG